MQRPPYSVSAHYRPGSRPPQPLARPHPAHQHPGHQHSPHQQSAHQHPVHPHPASPPYGPPLGSPAGMTAPLAKPQPRQVLMASGGVLALAALVISPNLGRDRPQEVGNAFTCIRQEHSQAIVSRGQLKQLVETDLEAPKATVQEFLKQPYCVLSPGKTEAGQPAEREAYPLEFDPQTWLVVLYEGDRYAGYDFRFR